MIENIKMGSTTVYILFGSNINNREQYIYDAQRFVQQRIGKIITESSLYETEAWGFDSDEMFLNKAIAVESMLNAFEILDATQNIEILLGRTAKTSAAYQSRIIDIDILFFGNEIIEKPQLTIPHPHMQNRRFVLLPLSQIAPDFIHPKLQKTIMQLLYNCSDNKAVSLWNK